MHSIVLIDDAADIRRLVRSRLRLSKAFDVVGEGSTGVDAVALAAEHHPDLMLLDMSMAGMDGLEAIPMILTASPRTRVVMYSGFERAGLADKAIALGASEFVPKSDPVADLPRRLLAIAGDVETVLADVPSPEPAENAVLSEHEERFRAAFEQAAIGMATMSLSGRLVRANAALARLVRTNADDLVGVHFTDLVESGDRNRVGATLLRVASGALDVDSLTHQLAPEHSARTATTTAAAVRDSAGNPLYLFVQVQDISDRLSAEESLRLSEERFRLLVESVRDYGIFVLDTTGHIISWNLGAERIKGWSAAEAIGQHFSIFYTDEAREARHPEYELEVAKIEGRYEEEGWRVRKDGSTFWANVIITAIRDDKGDLIGFAKVTRDVTERRELLETRERAAEERTEFLAMTAHELRGPIALLQGFSDLLHSSWHELDDEERNDMLETLVRSSNRLRRLVEDLLTASRLEAGVMDIRPQVIDLAPAIRSVVGDVASEVAVRCPEGVRARVDPVRLQQMLGNYLDNARRYGTPPVTIDVEPRETFVDVAVVDSGAGVDAATAARLFEKFTHGGHEGSTGLGLFIVRELARAQGGDAFVDTSSPTARFVLRLPCG